MASLGHIAIGLAAGRLCWSTLAPRPSLPAAMLALSALSLLPDADVIAFKLRIPYAAPFGHRGASHSLAAALACGLLCTGLYWLWSRGRGLRALYNGLLATAVIASHGLLDAMTDGGLGVALLWPISNHRYFAPWRPIPVAPIGARMLSGRGLEVVTTELLYFLPLLIYALWPRRRTEAAEAVSPESNL